MANAGRPLNLLDRKRLELARALAPAATLAAGRDRRRADRGECAVLVQLIGAIRHAGITIVWIEHIVQALLAVVTACWSLISAKGSPMASRAL